MKKRLIFFSAIILVFALVMFSACNRNNVEDENGYDNGNVVVDDNQNNENGGGDVEPPSLVGWHPALDELDRLRQQFPQTNVNNNPILQRGDAGNVLRMVIGADGTFPGLFNGALSSEAFDSQIMAFQSSPIIATDHMLMLTNEPGGISTFNFGFHEFVNEDGETVQASVFEINMRPGVYPLWHDGTPLTLDDVVFAYELKSRPEIAGQPGVGVRFAVTHFSPWILGIEEWRQDEADHISGLVLSNNNRTLRIYYDRLLPPAAQYAGGIWFTPTPRHHIMPAVEEVGWINIPQHAVARHEALGWGPFIIESIVPGESVLFRANDDYWRGAPLLDGVLWEIVPPATAMAAMRAGEYDFTVNGLTGAQFEEHLLFNPNNMTVLGGIAASNSFLYFRTGTFNFEESFSVPRPDGWHPIQDVNIRRALSHAMNTPLFGETIQNGLSLPAGTIIHPHNARDFIYGGIGGFFFDLAHAAQILDDAGYTQFGDDGYRLDLNGNPMYFVFAANQNTFNEEAIPTMLQDWRGIGLDVRLYTGDLIEWTSFLDNLLMSDNWSDDVHMFISGWSLGANPAPHSLWGADAAFNMSRHRSDEMIAILDRIGSQEAFDPDFLAAAYVDWQIYMYENAVAAQLFWAVATTLVNNRTVGITLERRPGEVFTGEGSHLWALTAPSGIANTN